MSKIVIFMTKQAMLYNITLRNVRAKIVVVKSNKCYIFWVYVFSVKYPAYNAHAPYPHMWAVRLYNICSHYLINGTILGGKNRVIEHKMCVLIFSTTFV
jgi:hypothetical protein